jgi:hypothetical protein
VHFPREGEAEIEARSSAVERSQAHAELDFVSEMVLDEHGLPPGPVGDALRAGEFGRRRLSQRLQRATADQTFNRRLSFNPHRISTEEQPAGREHRRSSVLFSEREVQSMSQAERVQLSIGWTGEKALYESRRSERLQQEMKEQHERRREEDRRRASGIYPGHSGFVGESWKSLVKARKEQETEMERCGVEQRGQSSEVEKAVTGYLTAATLWELQEQWRVRGRPCGRFTDAELELSQNLRALGMSCATPPSRVQPPTLNVPATSLRPESFNNFDDFDDFDAFDATLVPSPLRPHSRPRPRPRPRPRHPQNPGQDQLSNSFLGVRLASNRAMDKLQVRSPELSSVKAKAIEDARQMQAHVIDECTKAGKDPPPYVLVELIGKGSFGRVYMGYVAATSHVEKRTY